MLAGLIFNGVLLGTFILWIGYEVEAAKYAALVIFWFISSVVMLNFLMGNEEKTSERLAIKNLKGENTTSKTSFNLGNFIWIGCTVVFVMQGFYITAAASGICWILTEHARIMTVRIIKEFKDGEREYPNERGSN